MAGRPNKPLFELLREEGSSGRRETAPPTRLPPAPELKPVPAIERAPRPTPERAEEWSRSSEPGLASTTVIQLPVYAIYVTGAVALALAIAAWSIGWQMGMGKGKSEANPEVLTSEPPIVPPQATRQQASEKSQPTVVHQAGSESPGANPKRSAGTPPSGAAASKASEGTRPPVVLDASRPVIGASGALAADPRQPKLNYLVIAGKMEQDEAVALVDLLAKNNLEAVGVPWPKLDSSGKPTKNDGLFKVVATKGFTREQFRSKDPARLALQDAVIRVGQQQWKDSKRGRTDLSSCYWESLVP